MKLQEARELVARFNTGRITPEEHVAFLQWLTVASEEALTIIADTHESMSGSWALPGAPGDEWVMQLERKLELCVAEGGAAELGVAEGSGAELGVAEGGGAEEGVAEGPRERAAEEIKTDSQEGVSPVRMRLKPGGKRVKTGRMRMIRRIAAASVAGLLALGAYFYVHSWRLQPGPPGSGRTLLSMAVRNPRGSAQKAFALEDGSKVWLNPGSVLKFPRRFADDQRLVELSGEAFFDVRGSAERPFRVRIRDAEVDVEGTYFDVMAYDDEPESQTTVIEGAVKVTSGQQSEELRPGEQAMVTYSSPGVAAAIKVREGIDTTRILDWKKGIYPLDGTDLRTIMRVIARTYGVIVHYQPNAPDPLINGTLDLHKSLDSSLQLLRAMLPKNIQFIKNEKTLTVRSD